jgi:hypothetical protein
LTASSSIAFWPKPLNQAKEEHGNPLALIGIGNALLQIAEELGNLDWLGTMIGSLDIIAHSAPAPRGPWG